VKPAYDESKPEDIEHFGEYAKRNIGGLDTLLNEGNLGGSHSIFSVCNKNLLMLPAKKYCSYHASVRGPSQ
jgi:hypothetical protein